MYSSFGILYERHGTNISQLRFGQFLKLTYRFDFVK